MRFARRMGRRTRAYARKNNIPIIDCKRGQRKHEIAEQYLPNDTKFIGLFLITVSRAPNFVFDRVMETVNCIDVSWVDDGSLDRLPTPSYVGRSRMAGIDINNPRIRAVMDAIVNLSANPHGFTAAEIANIVRSQGAEEYAYYTSRNASYDLKKFRGKKLVQKIGNSRRYKPSAEGLRAITAIKVLRENIIKPILAGTAKPNQKHTLQNQDPVNNHYHHIQMEMKNLFVTLGLAA